MSSDEHLQASLYCAAELIRSHQRTSRPIPDWLRRHHARLDALSQLGQENDSDTEQLDDDKLITAREAAQMLGVSKRQCQRIAADLDGELIGGRWLFGRNAVVQYAEGRRDG